LVGMLDRRVTLNAIALTAARGSTLDILVEDGGRLNFGKDFILDRKGIAGDVMLNNEPLENWRIYPLPLDNLSRLKFRKAAAKPGTPAFYRGSFDLQILGDTYLDTTT